MMVSFV